MKVVKGKSLAKGFHLELNEGSLSRSQKMRTPSPSLLKKKTKKHTEAVFFVFFPSALVTLGPHDSLSASCHSRLVALNVHLVFVLLREPCAICLSLPGLRQTPR